MSLVFGGLMVMDAGVPSLALLTGVALVIAGVAYIAGV